MRNAFIPFFFITFFLLLVVPGSGSSYNPYSKYTINNGLSSNNVRNLYQDPFGYMWVSTEDGLNRFNGKKSVKYTNISSLKHRTLSPDIRATCYDSVQHLLYVLNSVKGFSIIDPVTGNVVKEIITTDKNRDVWNITMTYGYRKLWVGSSDGLKVYNIKSGAWENIPDSFFPQNINKDLFTIRTLHPDSQNRIWVFIENYGIVLLNAHSNEVLKRIPLNQLSADLKCTEMHFTSMIELGNDVFLIGTSEGLKQFTLSKNNFQVQHQPLAKACSLNDEGITAMTLSSGFIFIASQSALYKVDKALHNFVQIDDIQDKGRGWLNAIHYLYNDKEGNLWAACEQGLAYLKNTASPFTRVNNEEFPEAHLNNVYQVQPLQNNFLIAMKKGLLLYQPLEKQFKILNKNTMFNYFFRDHHSNLIVSAKDGLFIFKDGQLVPIDKLYPEWELVGAGNINSAVVLNDSSYVIGSENNRGIFIWDTKKKSIQIINNSSYPLKLSSDIVNKVSLDHQGNIWVLSDLGIDIINKQRTKITYLHFRDKKNKVDPILFFDMCETADHIWLTSYGLGLIQLDKKWKLKAIYNTDQGLSCNGIYKVFNYKDNTLLVTTNNGLSVFDVKSLVFHNFYETDGLHANSFEENCGMEYDGKFIAGGLNGFTIIDPSLIRINRKAPRLYIDRIELESPYGTTDTSNVLLTHLTIPSDIVRVSLHLSSLHFTNPTKTKISYKIDEVNEHWVSIDDQDMIQLIGLSPGTYTIRIRSANEHDFWNKKPVTLKLHFLPKWYQQIWFKAFIILLVLLFISLFYRYRLSQIKKQHSIRKNIANDLHDDIGSSLNTVKIFAHLAKKEKENMHYLSEIESALTMANAGMRDMIWVLDDTNDTWKELIERIKKFAHPLLSAQQIELKVIADNELEGLTLGKEEKKNLLLITKEAINNSVKYAGCKTISISLKTVNGQKMFSISDDGSGFELTNTTDGHGIKNIRYRAKLIRYRISYISSKGNGTSIQLIKE